MDLIRGIAIFAVVILAQVFLAEYLVVGVIRPDILLVLLIYYSARKGRISGILMGFVVGIGQDLTSSLTVLGANALSKSIVGFTTGTLNGTETVWTPRVINIYVYGSIIAHTLIYQFIMSLGLELPWMQFINRIFLEILISGMMVTGMRFIIPILSRESWK